MIQASIYGRLGRDPEERQIGGDKTMVTASLAVNAGRGDGGEVTVWISIVAFGRTSEMLIRHRKGDLLAAMGSLYRTRFTGRDGENREGWSLTVASLISARTVRPTGGRKRAKPAGARASTAAPTANPNDEELDDDVPF